MCHPSYSICYCTSYNWMSYTKLFLLFTCIQLRVCDIFEVAWWLDSRIGCPRLSVGWFDAKCGWSAMMISWWFQARCQLFQIALWVCTLGMRPLISQPSRDQVLQVIARSYCSGVRQTGKCKNHINRQWCLAAHIGENWLYKICIYRNKSHQITVNYITTDTSPATTSSTHCCHSSATVSAIT